MNNRAFDEKKLETILHEYADEINKITFKHTDVVCDASLNEEFKGKLYNFLKESDYFYLTSANGIILVSWGHLKKDEGKDDAKNFFESFCEKIKIFQLNYNKAYTQGAISGAFNNFNSDVSSHLGSFLDRKSGGKLAQVKTEAAERAKEKAQEAPQNNTSQKKPNP